MDRMVTCTFNNTKYFLNYSIEIMFDMIDKFGSLREAMDVIAGESKASFEAVRWFFVRMVNDAELCLRASGYDPKPMIEESDITLRITPYDYALMKAAVVDAINNGYTRETGDGDKQEIDLGLEEIRAKKPAAGE